MSSILDYIKSLVTVIKKPTILEDIRVTEQELKQKVIPAWDEAVKQFVGKGAIVSEQVLELAAPFSRIVGGKPADMPDTIVDRLKKLQGILVLAQGIVDKNFEDTTVADGMSILKINMLKIVDSASFISRYSMHLLNYIYVMEIEAKGEEGYARNHMSAGQIKWIDDNFLAYCQLLNALGVPEKQAEKLIDSMPDAVLGLDPSAVTSMLGEKAVNPIGIMGFSPTSANPIYHIRMFAAEYQNNRYKEAVALKTVLELRLLHLKRRQAGQFDAKIEKQIEYEQSRLDAVTEKIRQVEESIA